MRKRLFNLLLLAPIYINAQVGIGTDNPSTTLHVKESRNVNGVNNTNATDGVLIPKLTKQELALKSASNTYSTNTEGTLVFVSNTSGLISGPSSAKVVNITEPGFYFLNNQNLWVPLIGDTFDPSNDAWINNPTNSRVELSTTSKGAARTAATQVVVHDNGNLGINVLSPVKRLEINAANGNNATDVIRITNLAQPAATTITSTLQIDAQGNVGKKSEENVEGQILRLPILSTSVLAANFSGIKIDNNLTPAPNGAPNAIRMITGSTENSYTYPSSTSYPNATTDRISLPAGIYKIEVKIIGNFAVQNTGNSIALTTLVNGFEYSTQDFGTATFSSGQRYTGYVATDFIKLDVPAAVDFILASKQNQFNLVGAVVIGESLSYRSLILIQRIK